MLAPYLIGARGPGAYAGGDTDPGFPEPPLVTDVNGDVTISGKVKPGSFGKFVYPLATVAAGRQYTIRVVSNFSQLTRQGDLAMVGFGFKTGNDFHLTGLRGDGAGGTKEYIVHGTAPNGWNKQTGHTEVDNGAAAAGTQHSSYFRLTTSSDGTTYTLETSTNGSSWSTVVAGQALTPFSNVSSVTTFGVAFWFSNLDTGIFAAQITEFGAVASWQTTFSRTFNSNSDSWNNFTIRQVITAAMLSASGAESRVTIEAGSTEGLTLAGLNIQEQAGAGDDFDWTAAPASYLFSGSAGAVLTAGQQLVSDVLAFPIDETKSYVIAAFFNGGSGSDMLRGIADGGTSNYFKGGSDLTTVDASGYGGTPSRIDLINKIEVR